MQSIQWTTTPPSLTIKWSGGSVSQAGVNFLAGYVPQVDDWVEAIHTGPPTRPGGGDWLVLGTVGGGPWVTPTLGNSWVNYGSTFATAAYRKTGGLVSLRGQIKSGTINTAAFTLPSGYIPPLDLQFVTTAASAYALLEVLGATNANPGQVIPVSGSTAGFWLNCMFWVDS